MALKIELGLGQSFIIERNLIRNAGNARSILLIDGDMKSRILRGRDVMSDEAADTPAKMVYLVIQKMMLAEEPAQFRPDYQVAKEKLLGSMPMHRDDLTQVEALVRAGDLYRALRTARALVQKEAETLQHAAG